MNSGILATVVLLMVCATRMVAETPGATVTKPQVTQEVFAAKILQVHRFVAEGFEYVAYRVAWHGHEVFVTPESAADRAVIRNPGEEIQCIMTAFPAGADGAPARIVFGMGQSKLAGIKRLEEIADEVRRRRALREKAAKKAAEKD